MELAKYIDHTLLKAEASLEQVQQLCQEARDYDFKSVCVNPYWVPTVSQALAGSDVLVCTVIGFPLGANASKVKAYEAQVALEDGAQELDMVINIGAAKSGDWETVQKDIKAVVEVAQGKAIVKVIIETSLLTAEEIIKVSQIVKEVGADFVKTSTGFSTGGARVEDIRLIRRTVGPDFDIKASGGVGTYRDAMAMIEAGATRIGASKGIQILKESESQQ